MIKSLSPYYVSTPWVNPLGGAVAGESFTISIFIWDGLKAAVPVTAEYTKTIENPQTLITGNSKIDIARLISDFIEFAPQGSGASGVIDGNNNQWVKTQVFYENDATVQQEVVSLFGLGWTFGNAGENITTITNDILLTTQDYKVDRAGVFVVPVLIDESSTSAYSIISYPDNEINISTTIAASNPLPETVPAKVLTIAISADIKLPH